MSSDNDTPTPLPDGYEIRQLELKHITWVQAIIAHTMSFDSPLWAGPDYVGDKTKRAYDMFAAIEPSAKEGIKSGLSYGVFQKNWKSRLDGTKEGGEVRWDPKDLSATEKDLLKQMDFPLVSVAITKRRRREGEPKPQPPEGVTPWSDIVPLFATISGAFRTQEAKSAPPFASPERIAQRSGTHTRSDFKKQRLMRALAHYVMDQLAREFDMVVIQSTSDSVTEVWEKPPLGYKATVTGVFDTAMYLVVGKDGKPYNPFGDAKVVCKKIWVDLKPGKGGEGSGGKSQAGSGLMAEESIHHD